MRDVSPTFACQLPLANEGLLSRPLKDDSAAQLVQHILDAGTLKHCLHRTRCQNFCNIIAGHASLQVMHPTAYASYASMN